MKLVLYVVGGFVALAAAFLLIAGIAGGQIPEEHPVILLALFVLFGVPPLGAFWMIYMSIRYEKSALPMMLLAFIPFTFLWYYFERVRPKKVRRRDMP